MLSAQTFWTWSPAVSSVWTSHVGVLQEALCQQRTWRFEATKTDNRQLHRFVILVATYPALVFLEVSIVPLLLK